MQGWRQREANVQDVLLVSVPEVDLQEDNFVGVVGRNIEDLLPCYII